MTPQPSVDPGFRDASALVIDSGQAVASARRPARAVNDRHGGIARLSRGQALPPPGISE
ncbi:MAG: hypothetical protein QGF67_14350 [Lentisphaeria bacterium]|nr:hypothetical protein [Lentisphaeria bacterium]